MKFRKSAHATYKIEYHLVWIPRYRRKVAIKGVEEYAHKLLFHIPELDSDRVKYLTPAGGASLIIESV